MKNRLIPCVLACLMIFLVGCNGNTAKEAAQEITKTETSFPAGNTETNSQEDTAKKTGKHGSSGGNTDYGKRKPINR